MTSRLGTGKRLTLFYSVVALLQTSWKIFADGMILNSFKNKFHTLQRRHIGLFSVYFNPLCPAPSAPMQLAGWAGREGVAKNLRDELLPNWNEQRQARKQWVFVHLHLPQLMVSCNVRKDFWIGFIDLI